jgi:hypothetical protein
MFSQGISNQVKQNAILIAIFVFDCYFGFLFGFNSEAL